jgi:curved DNA-binding protein CbpA
MGQPQTDNYYRILGVESTATDGAIKTAYRKLVLIYHPDRSNEPNAVAIFTRIQRAYEVLSHPTHRQDYDRQLEINTDVAENYINVKTRFTSHNISMHVSKQNVQVGEPFTIIFRCPKRVQSFDLKGLENFELLKSVEHEMPYKGTIITQVHYVLKARLEGQYTLGPATANSVNIEYVSDNVTILVAGHYKKPTWAERGFFSKYYPALMIIIALLLPSLVVYNVMVYGVRKGNSPISERYFPFAQINSGFSNGTSLYPSTYDTTDKYAHNGQVIIENGFDIDVVFVLLDKNDIIVRNHFIKAGNDYTVSNIAKGDYNWTIVAGKGWSATLPSPIEGYFGNFKNGMPFGKVQPLHFEEKKDDTTVFYSKYTLKMLNSSEGGIINIDVDTGFYIFKY